MQAFVASFGRRKVNWVARQADVSEATLRAFLKAETGYMEEPTYDKLSAWSGWTVAELKGDAPIPTPNDILSRKNENGNRTVNDSLGIKSENVPGTTDGVPEREGQVARNLRLSIVNKIWDLPGEYLDGLKKHIEAIEDATGRGEARPQTRGKTGL